MKGNETKGGLTASVRAECFEAFAGGCELDRRIHLSAPDADILRTRLAHVEPGSGATECFRRADGPRRNPVSVAASAQ